MENALNDLKIKHKCVFSSEINKNASYTYNLNFKEYPKGDIYKCSKDIPKFDFLLGGFPCQPFSYAGKKKGFGDTRGTLFFEIERILREKKPYGFILENVEGLVKDDFVYFTGANSTVFSANPYQVTGVNGTTSFTVVQSGVSEISGGLSYLNYGTDNAGGNIQIVSSVHGLPLNSSITVAGSSNTSLIANGSKTVSTRVTDNTFFIPATAPLTESVTGTFDVQLSTTTTKHTPVNSINLANSTTLDSVISVFQGITEFPSISYIPNTTNQIYVTTKASFDSLGSSTSGSVISDTSLLSSNKKVISSTNFSYCLTACLASVSVDTSCT